MQPGLFLPIPPHKLHFLWGHAFFPRLLQAFPDRKHILCPVFSRVQWQSRQECDSHRAVFKYQTSGWIFPLSIEEQPQGPAELAAAEDGQRKKYKLLPLEVWMAIFVRYETAAVTGGKCGRGKSTCSITEDCVCDLFQKRGVYFPHWMRKRDLQTVTGSTCRFPPKWFPSQLTPEKKLGIHPPQPCPAAAIQSKVQGLWVPEGSSSGKYG